MNRVTLLKPLPHVPLTFDWRYNGEDFAVADWGHIILSVNKKLSGGRWAYRIKAEWYEKGRHTPVMDAMVRNKQVGQERLEAFIHDFDLGAFHRKREKNELSSIKR